MPNLPNSINVPKPRTSVTIPTDNPTFNMSFCLIKPVEKAMAFGGVLIGRHIAALAATAMPTRTVTVPPILPRLSPMPLQTTAKIGSKSAAVAVLLMKLLSP